MTAQSVPGTSDSAVDVPDRAVPPRSGTKAPQGESEGPSNGRAPASPAGVTRGRIAPSLWHSCRIYLLVGLAIRLLLAPWTAQPHDVAVWYQESARGLLNISLYSHTGFTYPPIWAYPLRAIGIVGRWIGLAPSDLAAHQNGLNALTAQLHTWSSPYVTTPGFNLAFKAVLFAFDLGTAWLIWRATLRLTSNPVLARRAFVLWWLSPLVIFESAVHGSFDTMVAFFALGSVVAIFERRFATAGAAVALGILTKVVPVFLLPLLVAAIVFPLGGPFIGKTKEVTSNVARFIGGGAAAAFVAVLPLLASGQFGSMVSQVSIRSSGAGGVGGLGLFGITTATQWNSLRTFLMNNFVGKHNTAVDIVVALVIAVAWPWWRRHWGAGALLFGAALAIAVPVWIQNRAQPQYLLWFLPFFCILAAPWVLSRLAVWTVGAGTVIFELGVLGPLTFLGPLAVSTGWLSIHSIVSGTQWLITTPGIVGPDRETDFSIAAWAIVTAAMGVLVASLGVRLHQTAIESNDRRSIAGSSGLTAELRRPALRKAARPVTTAAIVLALVGVIVTMAIGATGRIGAGTTMTVSHVSSDSHSPAVDVKIPTAPAPVRVVAFSSAQPVSTSNVFVYQDDRYPSDGATPSDTTSLVRDLQALLNPSTNPVTTVNASGLASLLKNTATADRRTVVLASGTLPSTVWTTKNNLLAPWIGAGGTVIWAGASPGLYSVGPAPTIVKAPPVFAGQKANAKPTTYFGCGKPPGSSHGRVIKGPVFYPGIEQIPPTRSAALLDLTFPLPAAAPRGSGGCVGRRPTPLATALEISYPDVNGGPTLGQIAMDHGLALGYLVGNRSSVSWLPAGSRGGGTLLFAGKLEPSTMASDINQILRTGILRTVSPTSWVTLSSGQATRIVVHGVPATARWLQVAGFEQSLNGTFFQQTARSLPR